MALKTDITLTWSKIMALLVLIAGVWTSRHFEDPSVMNNAIFAVVILCGAKQGFDALKQKFNGKAKENISPSMGPAG